MTGLQPGLEPVGPPLVAECVGLGLLAVAVDALALNLTYLALVTFAVVLCHRLGPAEAHDA